jgi:hypothetical protein
VENNPLTFSDPTGHFLFVPILGALLCPECALVAGIVTVAVIGGVAVGKMWADHDNNKPIIIPQKSNVNNTPTVTQQKTYDSSQSPVTQQKVQQQTPYISRQESNYKQLNILQSQDSSNGQSAGSTIDLNTKPIVTNQKLQNTVDALYRSGAIVGNGSTMDMVRYELENGLDDHILKAQQRVKNLENIIKEQVLSSEDLQIAEALKLDLKNALSGK